MKQLLSMSKQRKGNQLKPLKKQLILKQPQDQQYDFIYQDQDDEQDGPTDQEVRAYAQILGVRLPQQQDLLYIVRECLTQETPPEWQCKQDERGQIIYQNIKTGEISFQHPCDQIYRQRIISERKKKVQSMKKNITKINLPKSKTSFVENVFKKEQKQQQQAGIQNFVNDNIQKRKNKNNSNNPLYLNLHDNSKFNTDSFLYNQRPKHNQLKNNPLSNKNKNSKAQQQQQQQKLTKKQKLIPTKIETIFKKQTHPELVQKKKKQIQQKLHSKYQNMNIQLQDKYRQTIKNLQNSERLLREESSQQLKQRSSTKLERLKKQIQMKLMLQHSADLDKLRIQCQKQYRKDIAAIGSKYQIEQLFTQMAQCRKFIKRQKTESEKGKYMQQISQNLKLVNQLQIDKVQYQLQSKCRSTMHKLLDQLMKIQNTKDINWQMQSQLTNKYHNIVQQIINQYKQNINQDNLKMSELKMKSQQKMGKIQKQPESQQLYGQLENLRNKLNELNQVNNTQRSNLSEKQNKLFQLLQNKVSQNSAR